MSVLPFKSDSDSIRFLIVHPCGAAELLVDPLPAGASREGALYPDGAHLTDLKEVRGLLYKMQRPAIAPSVCHIILALFPF